MVKAQPKTRESSERGRRVYTIPFAFGFHAASKTQRALTFAILFLAVPVIVVNCHQRAMVQSEKSFISQTVLLAFGLKVASIVPLLLRRATRFRAVAAIFVNVQPTRIWLSGSRARV